MTIPSDVRPYGPATTADDDVTANIGGAADLAKTWEFKDVSSSHAVQLVSSNAGDVANTTVTVTGLDSGGNVVTDAKQPNGLTPVLFTQSFAQLLKATMPSAVTAGDIAVEDQVATRTATAVAGAVDSITLDAGASAVDQFYTPMIIRLTGGTGSGQIRKIIDYNGTTKIATVDRAWGTPPDATSVFRIATGMYFQLAPNQAIQVRRVLYNVVGPAFFQPTKVIYDKIFFSNQGTSGISNVSIVMVDPTGKLAFGVAATKNDTLTTLNRLTAPTGIAFGLGPTPIPGGSLLANDYIGVWVRMTVAPGDVGFIDTVDTFSAVWTQEHDMSVLPEDLKLYGSAVMADDDVATAIGGAISLSKVVQWIAFTGTAQAVSSDNTDTTQSITISYLDGAGAVQTITIALNGTTVVTNATSMVQVLKGIKSATTAGDVAVESQTAIRSNTAQAGTTDTITLDAGASAVDDFYRSMIVRLTGGTGANQIRQIVTYNGTTKVATVDRAWSTPPDVTSTFRIADGFMFDKLPNEILEVRRPFYNVSASASLTKTYYEKVFFKNTNGATTLSAAQVLLQVNPTTKVAFALETAINASGTNGGGNNRQIAPSSGVTTFDTAAKNVPGGQLATADTIGCWLQLTLSPGDISQTSSVTPRLTGSTP